MGRKKVPENYATPPPTAGGMRHGGRRHSGRSEKHDQPTRGATEGRRETVAGRRETRRKSNNQMLWNINNGKEIMFRIEMDDNLGIVVTTTPKK